MLKYCWLVSFIFTPLATGAEWEKFLQDEAQKVTAKHPKAGFVVGVLQAQAEPKIFGFGKVKTPLGEIVPDGHTIFEMGSITKTFTGVLLAEAVRRGEVKLTDSALKVIPEAYRFPPHPKGEPTLLDLATHRSGLPVQPLFLLGLTKNANNPYLSITPKILSDSMKLTKPSAAPGGAKGEYSNLATGLLGHALVEVAKADSYESLVRDRVLKPLGMKDTGEGLNGEQKSRLAVGHDEEGKEAEAWDFATLPGCGALRTSAHDMLRYARANLQLSEKTPLTESLLLAQKPVRDEPELPGRKIGLFWVNDELRRTDEKIVWHNGGTGGFRTMLLLIPARKIAIVTLAAHDLGDTTDRLTLQLAQEILGKKPK
ncbi:MAG: serine hydrolase domain-containing protein [Fimbriiglobus sp.]